jgi:hypothetical protein
MTGRPKGSKNKNPNFMWEKEHLDYLREHYPFLTRSELIEAFNKQFNVCITMSSLISTLKRYKITARRNGILLPKKNRIPWNKGRNYWNEPKYKEAYQIVKANQFKKGNVPYNTYENDFTIVIRKVKERPYQFIRLAASKWVQYHRWIWEQEYGAIPSGMIVIFKDGNSMNCKIDNLELISMAENANRNRNYMTNRFIARNMVGGKNAKEEDIQAILQFPDLIETKRQHILLNKKIDELCQQK